MKKKDIFLAAGICIFALIVWVAAHFFLPKDNQIIKITVNGELYGVYHLATEQVIAIGETNICEIHDGKVSMIEANCPDQLCVRQKAVGALGGTIVCLPNKVVIEAVQMNGTISGNGEVDAVV